MEAKTLAIYLLVGRIASLVVLGLILHRQIKIFRTRPDPELRNGRILMMVYAIGLILFNVIPILIDLGVIFADIPRNRPSGYGILYALDSNLGMLFASSALLTLYIIAEKIFEKRKSRP